MATNVERAISRPTLVQWRAVFAGAVVGLAVFALLTLLWTALAFPSAISFFAKSLTWWIGGSAIVSFFIGAFLTGWLSGVRGVGPGVANGVTMWGLLVVGSVLIPAILAGLHVPVATGSTLWASFWSVLIALGTAIVGGILGGTMPRPGGTTIRERLAA